MSYSLALKNLFPAALHASGSTTGFGGATGSAGTGAGVGCGGGLVGILWGGGRGALSSSPVVGVAFPFVVTGMLNPLGAVSAGLVGRGEDEASIMSTSMGVVGPLMTDRADRRRSSSGGRLSGCV